MPCVSTIPPKPSDRTIGSTTAPIYIYIYIYTHLSLSLSLLLATLTSPCITFCFCLTFCLRSWEYTEAIRNSIRSPWRDTAVYWTGPRHGGASHFLPREILSARRNAVYPGHDSHRRIHRNQGNNAAVFSLSLVYIYCIRTTTQSTILRSRFRLVKDVMNLPE